MFEAGLVSVSFRQLLPEKVISAAKNAGLKYIEWGSDVHAPCDDGARLSAIAEMQSEQGITTSSYGTYFRFGKDDISLLPSLINAAKILGTDILRVWCGTKGYDKYTDSEKETLFSDCRAAADIAKTHGVTLCAECHNNTVTDCKEGALSLMNEVNSPAFRMYWQPNQYRTADENIAYARALSAYTTHIHVFNWENHERFPLSDGLVVWEKYLSEFKGDRKLLLEFMPDDDPQSLPTEAASLIRLIASMEK